MLSRVIPVYPAFLKYPVPLHLALVDKILIYEDKKVEIVFRYRDEFARAMEIAKNYKDRPLPAVG